MRPMKTRIISHAFKLIFICIITTSCGDDGQGSGDSSDARSLLGVPSQLQLPHIPEFNPPTREKIELGRHLFYDPRLSGNQTMSCASCHEQDRAFADNEQAPRGSTGQPLRRNSQSLVNAVYHSSFTWAHNGFLELEDQIEVPILNDNPIELGVTDSIRAEVLARFQNDALYQELFAKAFPDDAPAVTINKIVLALASFTRSIISANSPFDRYAQGDKTALSAEAIEGLKLFNGEKFECFHCHSGAHFSVSYRDELTTPETITFPFFNNGLYNVNGTGSYPLFNQGLYELTQDPSDKGLFRPPSLRNVALTAPYMHDGSLPTLRDVVLHYARGGTLTTSGPNAGDGRLNPLKSGLVRGFQVSEQEMTAILAFLNSLTDPSVASEPRFANPFLARTPDK